MENFKNELELIKDEKLRAFTDFYLNNRVPSYFWEIGASASGKYHPPLVRAMVDWFGILKQLCISVMNS